MLKIRRDSADLVASSLIVSGICTCVHVSHLLMSRLQLCQAELGQRFTFSYTSVMRSGVNMLWLYICVYALCFAASLTLKSICKHDVSSGNCVSCVVSHMYMSSVLAIVKAMSCHRSLAQASPGLVADTCMAQESYLSSAHPSPFSMSVPPLLAT